MTTNNHNEKLPGTSLLLKIILAVSLIGVFCKPGVMASTVEKPIPKRILAIFGFQQSLPWAYHLEESLRATLASESPFPIELNVEHADLPRFPDETYRRKIIEFYRYKYSGKKLDLVLALGDESAQLLAEYGEALLGDTPIVLVSSEATALPRNLMGLNMTSLVWGWNIEGTIALIQDLLPQTQQLFLISGSSMTDRSIRNIALKAVQKSDVRFNIQIVTDFAVSEMLAKVSNLPQNSAIFYLTVFRDANDEYFVPRDLMHLVSEKANAPTFGIGDTYLGHGIVGGMLLSAGKQGEGLAQIAVKLLSGESVKDMTSKGIENQLMFDWRQLKRWSIDEDQLPEGSIVRYREPSVWEDYKKPILVVISLVIIETVLIFGLLINWQRRRKAERSLSESKEKVEEYSRTLEHKVEKRTQELARLVEELKALGEVSQAVSSTLNQEAVLTSIVRHAVKLSETDAGTIYEFDQAEEIFIPRTNHGLNANCIEEIRKFGPVVGDNTVMGQAALKRAPAQVPDLANVPDYPIACIPEGGFRALLAVPLLREDRLIGGLIVLRKAAGRFPARVVNLLQTFAAQSVLAIHNARLFHEIEEKRRELEMADKHKSAFLANMSHELRTPLNGILGYTELILDNIYGDVPEKIRGILERLETNGRHLLGLINDVLDLSKIEAGQVTLALNEYSIAEVVQTVCTSVASLAAEKQLDLKVMIAPDLGVARGDEQRIAQVLLNLIGNAIKFTHEGEVRVEVTDFSNRFWVSVTDTGPGISEADQKVIFQEFQQADGYHAREKAGSGLGLSIAQKIVEMHGGRIWVESNAGKGATFRFTLPLHVEKQRDG